MKVNHIGYLVKDLEKAKMEFRNLGYSVEPEVTHDELRGVDICFAQSQNEGMGGYVVELVSPYHADSVVAGMIKKHKNMPYHICYESECLENDLEYLLARGWVQIDKPCAAPAFDNRRVVFLVHSKVGMIELLEVYN